MTDTFDLATLSVRAGQRRTEFQEHSEALFLTSSFVFDSAAQAAARFTGGEEGFVYSRITNPTVSMFQDRHTLVLEEPDKVRQEAEDAIRQTKGSHFILGTGCVVPITASHGNYTAALESVGAAKMGIGK